jgi:hypothetical protein
VIGGAGVVKNETKSKRAVYFDQKKSGYLVQ